MRDGLFSAKEVLKNRLMEIKIDRVGLSDYTRNYFIRYRSHGFTILDRLAAIINIGLEGRRDQEYFSAIDYGGGLGLISLLLKSAQLGRVDYIDHMKQTAEDAKTLAALLGLPADSYHCGELPEVRAEFLSRSLRPNVVYSSEVIEHIFDLEAFFDELKKIVPLNGRVVLSTSANLLNPIATFRLRKIQSRYEQSAEKFAESFFSKRRVYIDKLSKTRNVSSNEIDRLAHLTRGLRFSDIDHVMEVFFQTKEFPTPTKDPTNTCDPATGNWCEKLMDPYTLAKSLANRGFATRVIPATYLLVGGKLQQFVKPLLNRTIATVPPRIGLTIAPGYILNAQHLGSFGSSGYNVSRQ